MLEIGGDFDDSIFGETKQKVSDGVSMPYSARTCSPQWYEDSSVQDEDGMHTVYKYRGDLAFYHERYTEALVHYDKCLDLLLVSNVAVWRDVQEARVRCFMHSGQQKMAVENAEIVMAKCENYEQKTTGLNVLCDVYRAFNCMHEEMSSVQGLLTLHPTNPDVWLRLADVYTKLTTLENSASQEHHECDSFNLTALTPHQGDARECCTPSDSSICITTGMSTEFVIYTCLLRAKMLLRSVNYTISSFAKTRNKQTQEKIEKQLEIAQSEKAIHEKCTKFLLKEKYLEDEANTDDNTKLEYLQKLTREIFEKKWFSWHLEGKES